MLLKRSLILLTAIFCLWRVTAVLTMASGPSNTLYVATDGNCGSASPCYETIQAAVIAAQADDIIKVAAGTYTGYGTRVVYVDKPLTIAGGYTTTNWQTPDPVANPTIIDAENAAQRDGIVIEANLIDPIILNGLIVQNAGIPGYEENYGILMMDSWMQMTNTIVQNNVTGIFNLRGHLQITDSNIQNNSVGIYTRQSEIEIQQSIIQDNTDEGIFGDYEENARIIENVIQRNRTGIYLGWGGVATISDNIIIDNGSGIYLDYDIDATIHNNNILGNNNSGIVLRGVDYALLAENNISDNQADYGGGVVILERDDMNPPFEVNIVMHRNILTNNQAAEAGNALYMRGLESNGVTTEVIGSNNILGNNGSSGTGVFMSNAILVAQHWTLVNSGEIGLLVEAGTANINNSVVADHSTAAFNGVGITADTVLFYNNGLSCMEGAVCNNELSGDPQFVAPQNGDFHIGSSSAAFNQGFAAGIDEDVDGDPRPWCGGYDLGADEYSGPPIGLSTLQLHEVETITNIITATLTWNPPITANSYDIRYADEPINDATWDIATVLTDTLAGTQNMYTATVPFNEGDHLYFALKYSDVCGVSPVSNNAFWPQFHLFLPTITQE